MRDPLDLGLLGRFAIFASPLIPLWIGILLTTAR